MLYQTRDILKNYNLEQRQYEDDIVWSTYKLVLKFSRFFTHLHSEWKSTVIPKLIWLPTKKGRSNIVFALGVWIFVMMYNFRSNHAF